MPAYTRNLLTVSGVSPKRFDQMAQFVMSRKTEFDFDLIIPMPEELDIFDASRNDALETLYRRYCTPSSEWSRGLGIDRRLFEEIRMNEKTWLLFGCPNPGELTAEDAQILSRSFKLSHSDGTEVPALYFGWRLTENRILYGAPTWYHWRICNWGTRWNAINPKVLEHGFGWEFDTVLSPAVPIARTLSAVFVGCDISLSYSDEDIGRGCGQETYNSGRMAKELIFEDGSWKARTFALKLWDKERMN
ncbi:MAG: hypothetical protein E7576_07095 [Ruminococcaceae bacterium]|nr:hypothetical protein [Oscillospiraceae bacterium]